MEQINMQEAFDNDPGAEYRGYLAGETEGAYMYDKIGNLFWDQEEGFKITWTAYGKVRQVICHNGENIVTFQYDATGNRIRKSVVSPDTTYSMSYLRDASGNVLSVYDQVDVKSHYLYGSSRLGENRAYSRVKGQQSFGDRSYEISNHLGNVLAVLSDERHQVNDSIWSKVKSTTDYYPFGLEMKGRSVADYRYGFNGKEKDGKEDWGGSSHYDYGFRIYNPEIGKFLSVDPLTKSYPMLTPYQFASNTPIRATDLDGLEAYVEESNNSDGSTTLTMTVDLEVKNSTTYASRDVVMNISNEIKKTLEDRFSGYDEKTKTHYVMKINLNYNENAEFDYNKSNENGDFFIYYVDKTFDGERSTFAAGRTGGFKKDSDFWIGNTDYNQFQVVITKYDIKRNELEGVTRTGSHEIGHGLGLEHSDSEDFALEDDNLLRWSIQTDGTTVNLNQIKKAFQIVLGEIPNDAGRFNKETKRRQQRKEFIQEGLEMYQDAVDRGVIDP